jgi:hypothetical protein
MPSFVPAFQKGVATRASKEEGKALINTIFDGTSETKNIEIQKG